MTEQSPLPMKKTKKWKTSDSIKKTEFKPLHPNFCPNVKDDGTKCGKYMRNWDTYFYDKYGVGCEQCTTAKIKSGEIVE